MKREAWVRILIDLVADLHAEHPDVELTTLHRWAARLVLAQIQIIGIY